VARCFITTIGCKVNQYESQAAGALLERLGLMPAPREALGRGDLVCVNTCCVTSAAAAKSRRAIRRAVRNHPGADLFIFGCYATRSPDALRRLAIEAGAGGEVHVVGHDDDVAACLARATASREHPGRPGDASSSLGRPAANRAAAQGLSAEDAGPCRNEGSMRASPGQCPNTPGTPTTSDSIEASGAAEVKCRSHEIGTAGLGPLGRFAAHQRAFVKVQDGCDAFCAYCIVPHVRRHLWWRRPDEVVAEVETLVAAGHREVVLCGAHLGAYGRDGSGPGRAASLGDLVRRVAVVPGLWRVRLSSLHVADMDEDLLAAFGECPAVAPHAHLSLQSGSRAVLRRMNRHYTPGEFLDTIARLRATADDFAVTTDVIVGFPHETEADFAETLAVARAAQFSKIHIFPFSPREGTAAWAWRRDAPPRAVVKDRCRRLAVAERELAQAFRQRFVGRIVEALAEKPNAATPPAHARALTDRYVEIVFPAAADLAGQVVPITVTRVSEAGLTGRAARRV